MRCRPSTSRCGISAARENRSIHELVGGYRNWAPTCARLGYPFFDEKQLAEYGRKFVADGHKMLKMVVGGEPTRRGKTMCEGFVPHARR